VVTRTFKTFPDAEADLPESLALGTTVLTINQISTAANFSLGGSDTTCSSTAQILIPDDSCVLGIEFNPLEGGSITGPVRVDVD